jgi:hypothetical protein
MRFNFLYLVFLMMALGSSSVFAVPPIISNNVPVLQNTTPAQCPSDWEGPGGAGITETVSGQGQSNDIASPGVLSCSGCVFDPKTKNCTCSICYDYFDD